MRVADGARYRHVAEGRRERSGQIEVASRKEFVPQRKAVSLPGFAILATSIDCGDAFFGDQMHKAARDLGLVPDNRDDAE